MKRRIFAFLKDVKERGNYRYLTYIKPLSPSKVLIDGKEYINLCSNSYLSLQFHPYVIKKTKEGIDVYGCGTCSSRSVSGSFDIFQILEERITRFKGYKKGLLFSSGYLANIGIISSIITERDIVFSDELNHASIIDGIRLTKAKKVIYKHRDMEDLEKKIRKEKGKGKKFLITETVFSMDGDIAPLREIYELKKKYDLYVIVDDAHGTGVFGEKGRGIEEHLGVNSVFDIHIGTFGKALGSYGAFVLGEPYVIEFLINRARTFMYTTALPASSAISSLSALDLLENESHLREELWANIAYMRRRLSEEGFDLKESEGPIVPLFVGDDKITLRIHEVLLQKGIFLQAIRPPTVPPGTARLRLTVIRGLKKEEMDYAVSSLKEAFLGL